MPNLGTTVSIMGANNLQTAVNYAEITNQTASSTNWFGGMGVYTAAITGMPVSVPLNAIAQTGSSLSQANIALVLSGTRNEAAVGRNRHEWSSCDQHAGNRFWLTRGGTWKKQRIVVVVPTAETVSAEVMLANWNLAFPPNNGVIKMLALGQEVARHIRTPSQGF